MAAEGSITNLLLRAREGDSDALTKVFDAAYGELRALARARLRRAPPNTLLDTTSLVHEAFLRFADLGRLRVDDREHFLKYASHAMRSVIVDFVRERMAQRRGGGAPHVTLNSEVDVAGSDAETEILRVHEALEELGRRDARLVQVVEMRYFAGMTDAEVGQALGMNERTVRRDWEKARLLLAEALV
jgi:RNA polymerase sigma factor (TIGR02999 family)